MVPAPLLFALITILLAAIGGWTLSNAQAPPPAPLADMALIVAIDVSQSVDLHRYRLQMEGMAQALEDPDVQAVMTGGPEGAILFTLVVWADKAEIAIPWQRIANRDEALRTAALVRRLPYRGGEFTCMARLLRYLNDFVVPEARIVAARIVADVSGDGIDNCSNRHANDSARDALIASGATINGLPIFVPGENDVVGAGTYRAPGYNIGDLALGPDTDMTTLDTWYLAHIVGGPGAFLYPAHGYEDFGRAIRRKFVIEISGTSRIEAEASAP